MAEPAWMPAFICPRCASPLTASPGVAPTWLACGAGSPLRCEPAAIARPPLAPGVFDAASFHVSLHCSNDPARTLRQARAMLAPGGTMAVVDSPVFATDDGGRRMLDAQHIAFGASCERAVR